MRTVEVTKLVVGSWVVFVVVVALGGACGGGASDAGAGGGAGHATKGGSTGGTGGNGGKGGSGAGLVSDVFADEAGSRLKPNVIKGADGATHSLGTFRDTQRDEDCSFADFPDGSWRCLPTAAYITSYFADSACSEPLGVVTTPCSGDALPKYAWRTSGSGCGTTTTLFSLESRDNGAQVYIGSSGSCTATPASTSYAFFRVGAAVSLGSFVAGTKSTE